MLTPIILLAFADSRQDLPELSEERRALDDLLTGPFEVKQKDRATLGRIEQVFNVYGRRIRVFHFGGHADGKQIELVQGKDGHAGGYVNGVAEYVGKQKGVELVFLNGCSTEGQVAAFRQAGIPAVIATTAPIKDRIAREFSELFYQNFLGRGGKKSLQEAFDEAKSQLKGRYDQNDSWYNPGMMRDRYSSTAGQESFPYELFVHSDRAKELCYQDLMVREEGKEKAVPPQAHLLCDRDNPNEEFEELLKDHLLETERRPLLCLVHGEEEELPIRLCDRFEHFSLKQSFRSLDMVLEPSRFERVEVDMPLLRDFQKAHKAMDRVKESLKFRLDMQAFPAREIRRLTAQHILDHLGSHLKVVLFQHNLYPEKWDMNKGTAFLEAYIKTFWNVPLPPQSPDILLLFSLQDPPRRGLLKRWTKPSPKIPKDFAAMEVEVLSRLQSVSRVDVRDWNDRFAADEPSLTDQIFQGKSLLPMRDILPKLQATVNRRRS